MVNRTRALLATCGVALVTALAGCGSDGSPTSSGGTDEPTPSGETTQPTSPGETTGPPESGSPGATTPPPASPIPPPTSAPSLPGAPPPKDGEVVLDGVVEAGVEAGCRILRSTQGDYLLLGEPEDGEPIPMGVPVRVRGMLTDQVFSYCQQGTPFTVIDVARQ